MNARVRTVRPLADLTFSVVGPGKVGSSLAMWAVARGAEALAVAGRGDSDTARSLAGLLDGASAPLSRLGTADQDLLLLAVPDPELPEVVRVLAGRRQAAVVLHTSGRYDATVLQPLTARGSTVGSLHPLKAFPRPLLELKVAAGTVFGIDGSPKALSLARRLVDAWGGRTTVVPTEGRLIYHFAATLAAGGVVTLLAAAADLAGRRGLGREVVEGFLELARDALEQATTADDPAAAVTGPVVRRDRDTVFAELDALEETAPEMSRWAVHLALESLRQRSRWTGGARGGSPDADSFARDLLDRLLEGAPTS